MERHVISNGAAVPMFCDGNVGYFNISYIQPLNGLQTRPNFAHLTLTMPNHLDISFMALLSDRYILIKMYTKGVCIVRAA